MCPPPFTREKQYVQLLKGSIFVHLNGAQNYKNGKDLRYTPYKLTFIIMLETVNCVVNEIFNSNLYNYKTSYHIVQIIHFCINKYIWWNF